MSARVRMNVGRGARAPQTGNSVGAEILSIFEELVRARGVTLIMVTHDPAVAERAERVIKIRDGAIESEVRKERAA